MSGPPRSSYLLCTLPRSGSWLLSEGLLGTGVAGRPEEYFWPGVRDLYVADWSLPDDIAAEGLLERILEEGATDNGVFGAKVHGIQMPALLALLQEATGSDLEAAELLPTVFPDLRLVGLERVDRTGRALSWYRALATDNWWHIEGANDRHEEDGLTLDPVAVARLEERLAEEDAQWNALFDAIGVPVLRVTYEELDEQYERTIRAVLEFLEVEAPERIEPPRLARQADELTQRWREEYEAGRVAAAVPAAAPLAPQPSMDAAPLPELPAMASPAWDLAPLLGNRRWWFSTRPFRHVVAHGVFAPEFYEQLLAAFQAMTDGDALAYNTEHDFVGRSLNTGTEGPLSVFVSEQWHDLFARLFGIVTTGQSTAGIHRHFPGSRNGFPHNDISPQPLVNDVMPDEIIVHGGADAAPADNVETVRAVAILFYLNNGPWRPSHGGQTGMYRHWSDPVSRPLAAAPPVDNSLLAFECSPYSYHSFMANSTRRDSVISFLYRTLDDFVAVWGPDGVRQYAEG
jgi:LPS sulfotransferase NodH